MKNLNNLHKSRHLNKTGTYAFLQSLLELTKKVRLTVDKPQQQQQQQLVEEDVDGVEPVGRMTDRETLQVCQCPTAKYYDTYVLQHWKRRGTKCFVRKTLTV